MSYNFLTAASLVVRVSRSGAKDIEPAAQPAEYIVDNGTQDLAFYFMHFENFQPEIMS